jgi:acyl dehydratase
MERRTLTITDELIVRYSRRGNFHSEPDDPAAIALGGLVAQGTQVCGPAYGALLEAWGEDFLDHGELDLRFVGMVRGGDTVDATVEIAESTDAADDAARGMSFVSPALQTTYHEATIEVRNTTTDIVAAVGTARCRGSARS